MSQAAGWYPDPMRAGTGWRWWNGAAWTPYTEQNVVADPTTRKPRLPRWLSGPVAWCAPLVAIGVVVMAALDPISVAAALVPLLLVLPAVQWFDRVEPEPRASRVHAVLWGACVAVLVAVVINTLVAVVAGDTASMVLSAPIVEEGLKALGVVWAVRRREVDSVTDGIVYAAWVAIGFAVVEDMTYFTQASVAGGLLPVFVLRAVLTPFAHPLFTFWSGLAIGRAVQADRRLWPSALWGYGLAVLTHMAWNGSLSIGQITTEVDDQVAGIVVAAMALLFVVLFTAVMVVLIRMRNSERERFVATLPGLILRYHVAPDEAAAFRSWGSLLAARKQLPRSARSAFDAVHASLARLSLRQADPHAEQALADQLREARQRLNRLSRPGRG